MSEKPTYEEIERMVSELKMTREALDESAKRHRLLYEQVPVMVHFTDSSGKLRMVNDYWLTALGYAREEVIGRKSIEFLTPESQAMAVHVYLPEVLRTGRAQNIPCQMVRKNGQIIDVLLSAASEKDAKGESIQSVAVIIDSTERKLTEENLKIYANIVSSTPDGIAFLDASYRYRIVNDAYEKFSGVKRESFIGLTVAEYLGEDIFVRHVKPNFDRCLHGETVSYQKWFDYPTLGQRFAQITYFPYRNARNRIVGVVANTRDITEQKLAQNDLRSYAQKLEEKNIALNVLLENRAEEKKKLADSILKNFERLVFPYYEKLKKYHGKKDLPTILNIIQTNTQESLSLLENSVPSTYRAFTPMEIQVADLIKAGKTSKQIAAVLNISPRSVFFHRNNIRKKLNIHKTKTNLRSFLISLR